MIAQASPAYSAALTQVGRLWHRLDVEPPAHDRFHPDLVAEALVNEGRWVVACPCGGAQLASRAQPRFMCVDCAGASSGGLWVHVAFPANAAQIEAALAPRPRGAQNWRPGETVEDLAAENRLYGVNP